MTKTTKCPRCKLTTDDSEVLSILTDSEVWVCIHCGEQIHITDDTQIKESTSIFDIPRPRVGIRKQRK